MTFRELLEQLKNFSEQQLDEGATTVEDGYYKEVFLISQDETGSTIMELN